MIYFMQSLDKIKVGFTKNNAIQRKKALEIGNPHGIIIIGVVTGNSHHEKIIHKDLSDYQVIGEWFIDCKKVRNYISYFLNNKKVCKYRTYFPGGGGSEEIKTTSPKWLNYFNDYKINKAKNIKEVTIKIKNIEKKINYLFYEKKKLELKYLKIVKEGNP